MPITLPFLERPEQLRLQPLRQLADLVQEQHPPVGLHEQPRLVAPGVGDAPARGRTAPIPAAERIPSLNGTAEYRVPDTATDLTIEEVKNVPRPGSSPRRATLVARRARGTGSIPQQHLARAQAKGASRGTTWRPWRR